MLLKGPTLAIPHSIFPESRRNKLSILWSNFESSAVLIWILEPPVMAHNPTNRRKLPTAGSTSSTTSTPTVYNLTNHLSRLHHNPKPTNSHNPLPVDSSALSKSADFRKQGKKVVLASGKSKSLVVVEDVGESNNKQGNKAPFLSRSFTDAQVELGSFLVTNCAKVVSADMPPFMQVHAVTFARKIKDSLEKFTSKNLALSLKKEFDGVYGPAWHCIVGTSFGSFVTHSVAGFLYFSLDQKLYILLFKTAVQRAD